MFRFLWQWTTSAAVETDVPTNPGLEYTLAGSLLNYSVKQPQLDYSLDGILHYSWRNEGDVLANCLYWVSGYGDPDYVETEC